MSVAASPPAARRSAAAAPPPRLASLRALLRRGLRDDRYVPLIWGGALGVFSFLIIFTWPSIEDSVGELVRSYPEGLKQAFGIEQLDTVEAYFDAEMLSLIVPLAVAFLAVRTVARAIPGAEEEAWLDTLLTTPLSRASLVAGAFLVTAALTALALALTAALTLIAGLLSGTDPAAAVIGRGLANVWPLAMFFAGLATLLAGRLHSASAVTAIASGVLVAMYLIDVVGKVSDSFEPLRWASAFKYYGSAVRDGIDPVAFIGLTLAAAALAALGALLLERRDIVA